MIGNNSIHGKYKQIAHKKLTLIDFRKHLDMFDNFVLFNCIILFSKCTH